MGILSVIAALTILSVPAAASPSVDSRLLSITDMPAGWSVTHHPSKGVTSVACLSGLNKAPHGGQEASAAFSKGGLPVVGEKLATGGQTQKRWFKLIQKLQACRTFSYSTTGKTESGTIGAESFPRVGTISKAFVVTLTVTNVNAGVNLVFFGVGSYYGLLLYGDVGTPSVTATEAFADEAVAKAEGKPVTPPTTTT